MLRFIFALEDVARTWWITGWCSAHCLQEVHVISKEPTDLGVDLARDVFRCAFHVLNHARADEMAHGVANGLDMVGNVSNDLVHWFNVGLDVIWICSNGPFNLIVDNSKTRLAPVVMHHVARSLHKEAIKRVDVVLGMSENLGLSGSILLHILDEELAGGKITFLDPKVNGAVQAGCNSVVPQTLDLGFFNRVYQLGKVLGDRTFLVRPRLRNARFVHKGASAVPPVQER